MPIKTLVFDLDGTLYDGDNGYTQHVHNNIFKFMVECEEGKFADIKTIEQAKEVWRPIFDKWNLTKRGFAAEGYQFDADYYDR